MQIFFFVIRSTELFYLPRHYLGPGRSISWHIPFKCNLFFVVGVPQVGGVRAQHQGAGAVEGSAECWQLLRRRCTQPHRVHQNCLDFIPLCSASSISFPKFIKSSSQFRKKWIVKIFWATRQSSYVSSTWRNLLSHQKINGAHGKPKVL